jgi:hypothetical protein
VDHISGNKGSKGLNEVPIDRENPEEEPIMFPYIAIKFYGRGWPSKLENVKKRHKMVQIGRIGCATRP